MATSFKPCSVDGCNGDARHSAHGCRGYCCSHYKRWKRHGDPLAGKPSYAKAGEPMAWLLAYVDYDGEECLTWPFGRTSDGRAKLGKGTAYRTMCEIVNGSQPSPDHESAHNCGKGHEGCVHPRHLRWDTPFGNQKDRLKHGTHNRGTRNRNNSLTPDQVREIRALRGKMIQYEIAEKFGITQGAVNKIHVGRTWEWLK